MQTLLFEQIYCPWMNAAAWHFAGACIRSAVTWNHADVIMNWLPNNFK